jgi:hypothetical protein
MPRVLHFQRCTRIFAPNNVKVKQYFQTALKFVIPLLFGCGIFWFLTRNADLEQVSQILKQGISWGWVGVSLVLALLSHIVRGIRWRRQLRTFGANLSTHDMSISIFGNYGLNLVFPRLGEVWRCNYVAHRAGVSFSTTVGSMISERVVDMTCSLALAVAAFSLQSRVLFSFFDTYTGTGSRLVAPLKSPLLWGALGVAAVTLFLVRHRFSNSRPYRFAADLCRKLWKGVVSLRQMRDWKLYLVDSVALWALYFLNSYTSLFFFDFTAHLGLLAGLMIFVMGSLSLLIPVQGGLGAWHAMVIFTLGCYGIGASEAFSFALVSWTIEQGFVLVLGLYALLVVLLRRNKVKTE